MFCVLNCVYTCTFVFNNIGILVLSAELTFKVMRHFEFFVDPANKQ